MGYKRERMLPNIESEQSTTIDMISFKECQCEMLYNYVFIHTFKECMRFFQEHTVCLNTLTITECMSAHQLEQLQGSRCCCSVTIAVFWFTAVFCNFIQLPPWLVISMRSCWEGCCLACTLFAQYISGDVLGHCGVQVFCVPYPCSHLCMHVT